MKVETFKSANGNCQGQIVTDDDWNMVINGLCKITGARTVKYAASAPADLRMSYMGSGLPFPNEDVAYEGTVNMGEVNITNDAFTFKLVSPNSYYKNNGATLVAPHVHFTIGTEYFDIPLPSARLFPNRSLTSIKGRPDRVIGR
jgi:hypothetical protein